MSAEGEWTKENMAGKWSRGEEWIMAEHNAALAAEREQWQLATEECHRIISRKNDELAERERLAAAQQLMAEVRQLHSNKDCAEYNECDTAPCQWCEWSLKLGVDCMDAHIRQKTWELEKQLAAERQNKDGYGSGYATAKAEYSKQLAAERETKQMAIDSNLRLREQLDAERNTSALLRDELEGVIKDAAGYEKQLAAERERADKEWKKLAKMFDDKMDENKQLREQLAAERKKK